VRISIPPVTLVLLALLSFGCAGSFDEARSPHFKLGAAPPLSERCQSLDSTHRTWGAVAKGSGFLAGVSGLGAIPDTSQELRIGLAVGAVTMGAVAVTSVFVSEDAASSFVRECTSQ
jgi:hypothetical protein